MKRSQFSPQRQREHALYRYRKALERGDFDTVAAILKQAEYDPVLDGMIGDMSADDAIVPELKSVQTYVEVRQNKPSLNGQPPNFDQHKENVAMTTEIAYWQHQHIKSRRSNSLATAVMALAAVILLGGILLVIRSSSQLVMPLSVQPTQQSREIITPENIDQLAQVYTIPKQKSALSLVSFSPDSMYLAYENNTQQIVLWNLETHMQDRVFPAPEMSAQGRLIVFSPDGKYLATNGEHQISIWNLETGAETRVESGAPMWQLGTFSTRMAFSQDGKQLYRIVCGHGSGEAPQCDRLDVFGWDVVSSEQIAHTLEITTAGPNAALLPAANLWVESNAEGQLVLHDLTSSNTSNILLYNGPSISLVAGSPDGTHISVVDTEPSLKVFDTQTGSTVMNSSLKDQQYAIKFMAFAPGNSLLASVGAPGDKTVQFWNVENGQIVRSLDATENNYVFSAAFSPDGTLLMTDSNDDMIRIWGIASES